MAILKVFTNKNDGNLAFHVGDKILNVEKNREKLKNKYSFSMENLRYMNQVHKDSIKIVNKNSGFLIDDCDALITNEKNLPIMVMVADCIPILLYDEKREVIATIHAGRNSTFLNIASKTALKMIKKFNCEVKDIKAILGPSIQKCCYEVSEELVNIVKTSFSEQFVNNRNIDLQGINKMQLNNVGIKDIKISDYCTKCCGDDYFSYRKSKKTGRFAGIIELKD
ncbi:multicopper polyphenol oxidase [Malaciobacter molluscorum LMG 25693]|uniref:Purine nucleoside phosphorylase n=1 Tax=Malaciobacter molluscorum LMG 25693 TaxID=870501 RepID=A0A2G1DKE0_9BACT|nr:peptidoglycan editing factor PgeF [Malaciobacter molluscorum]AXX92536.1 multi-copper polyphenol oxidoreductase laccase [Malaciobacter molluscorum LMG 25693]PHO18962.1 multicopper polyphenol oxidase [Malaciobacter molluscorum LMG 25693]